MFTKSKIALAAAMIISAAPAALANDHEVDKWYPETPQEILQMQRATDTFRGGNAYDFSDHKRGSSQKQLQRHEN